MPFNSSVPKHKRLYSGQCGWKTVNREGVRILKEAVVAFCKHLILAN
jgi:hypothetical protein